MPLDEQELGSAFGTKVQNACQHQTGCLWKQSPETTPEFIDKHPPAAHGYQHNLTNIQLVIAFLKRELVAEF